MTTTTQSQSQSQSIAEQPRSALNDAAITAITQDGEGQTYVVFADDSRRRVNSWAEACEMMRAGKISRILLGIQ